MTTNARNFKLAHAIARKTIQAGDDYRTTFGAALKLVIKGFDLIAEAVNISCPVILACRAGDAPAVASNYAAAAYTTAAALKIFNLAGESDVAADLDEAAYCFENHDLDGFEFLVGAAYAG